MHEDFIKSIHGKIKMKLTFSSKEDGRVITRLCAPMDYGPSRRAADKTPRYHLWDYESDKQNHVLSLLPSQVVAMEATQEIFNPAEFITWQTNWFVPRDWGRNS